MEQENKLYECRRLTTADIAKVFLAHVDRFKMVKTDRNDYFEFARAIEQELLRKAQDK
jgi:hypothetical protein